MSEQLTLGGGVLPTALVVAFGAHELRAKRRPSILTARSVINERGRWWLELIVDGKRHFALVNRVDLDVAAADLFHMVHGEAPPSRGDA
jgi:hypothetical protein